MCFKEIPSAKDDPDMRNTWLEPEGDFKGEGQGLLTPSLLEDEMTQTDDICDGTLCVNRGEEHSVDPNRSQMQNIESKGKQEEHVPSKNQEDGTEKL